MSNPQTQTSNTGIGGPGFVSLLVRDIAAAADFYEHKIGLKRDPQAFPGTIQFLTTPSFFAVSQLPPGEHLDSQTPPGRGIAVWFRAADGQAAHDALVKAGVTIVRHPFDGPFGRTFTFADLDGYTITVYEQDEPIIDRLPPAQ